MHKAPREFVSLAQTPSQVLLHAVAYVNEILGPLVVVRSRQETEKVLTEIFCKSTILKGHGNLHFDEERQITVRHHTAFPILIDKLMHSLLHCFSHLLDEQLQVSLQIGHQNVEKKATILNTNPGELQIEIVEHQELPPLGTSHVRIEFVNLRNSFDKLLRFTHRITEALRVNFPPVITALSTQCIRVFAGMGVLVCPLQSAPCLLRKMSFSHVVAHHLCEDLGRVTKVHKELLPFVLCNPHPHYRSTAILLQKKILQYQENTLSSLQESLSKYPSDILIIPQINIICQHKIHTII